MCTYNNIKEAHRLSVSLAVAVSLHESTCACVGVEAEGVEGEEGVVEEEEEEEGRGGEEGQGG